jgi:hypothetical protein
MLPMIVRPELAALAAALLAFGSGNALAQQAETQYVVEQLFVTVNEQADGSGERVDQIKSGDRVEVLDRQDEQTHVRLPSGKEGWVKSSYLSTTAPMRDQLKARTDELEKVRAEKTRLETELAGTKKAATAAAAAASSVPAVVPPPATVSESPSASGAPGAVAASEAPPPSNPPMFADSGVMPSRPSWLAALAVSLLTLAAGFALGWRVLDKRIRAKYGGLRIY